MTLRLLHVMLAPGVCLQCVILQLELWSFGWSMPVTTDHGWLIQQCYIVYQVVVALRQRTHCPTVNIKVVFPVSVCEISGLFSDSDSTKLQVENMISYIIEQILCCGNYYQFTKYFHRVTTVANVMTPSVCSVMVSAVGWLLGKFLKVWDLN